MASFPGILSTPRRGAGPPRAPDLGWAAAATLLGAGVGVAAGVAPLLVAGVAAAIAAAALFATRPIAVLCGVLLIRASIDRDQTVLDLGAATPEGALNALVFAGGAIALLVTGARTPARTTATALLAGLAVSGATLLWTLDRDEGARTWLHVAGFAIVFLVAAASFRRPASLQRLVDVTLISSLVPIAVGLVQLATGSTYTRQGFSAIYGTFGHSNGYAFYLLVVLTLALVTLMETRRPAMRPLATVILAGGSVVFVMTYTRSAWIGITLVLLILAAVQYRRLVGLALVVAVVTAVAVPSSVGVVTERFADLSAESSRYSDNSLSWRSENWSRMFHFALERPVGGWGVSSYPMLAVEEFGRNDPRFAPPDEDDPGVYAHNDYLRLAVEEGVAGLLLWATVLVSLCVAMWRSRRAPPTRPVGTAMFAVMVAVIFISAVDNLQGYTGVMYYLMALCGAVAGVFAGETARTERPG